MDNTTLESLSYFNLTNASLLEVNNISTIPPYHYIYASVTILCVILFIAGVGGNVLVIFVIFKNSDMRTATNMFLANLSLADLLVILICLPSSLLEFHAKSVWYLGDFMCRTVIYLENLVSTLSILTILSISFERYLAIFSPLRTLHTCTKKRAFKILTSVWICSFVINIPFLLIARTTVVNFYDGTLVVKCEAPIVSTWKRTYVLVCMAVFFALPLGILIMLYSLIGSKLIRPNPSFQAQANSTVTASRIQVVYMLVAVVILFFVCLLPIKVLNIWNIYSSLKDKEYLGLEAYLLLISFARIMFYINSVGNPVLYNLVSSRFREACMMAIGRRSRRPGWLSSVNSGRSTATREAVLSSKMVAINPRGTGGYREAIYLNDIEENNRHTSFQ